mgnify:CR=1 FL=1
MKLIIIIYTFISSFVIFSQNTWQEYSKEKKILIDIHKTSIHKIQNFTLDIIWDTELSYSENIGYYGGIKKLTIYKGNKVIQVINNIEDNIALGNILFNFYDYNLDGHIDFTLPINSRWLTYYIFNQQTNKFEHKKEWDYLRIQKIDKKNKRILTIPDGNAYESNRKTYQIRGMNLIKI